MGVDRQLLIGVVEQGKAEKRAEKGGQFMYTCIKWKHWVVGVIGYIEGIEGVWRRNVRGSLFLHTKCVFTYQEENSALEILPPWA